MHFSCELANVAKYAIFLVFFLPEKLWSRNFLTNIMYATDHLIRVVFDSNTTHTNIRNAAGVLAFATFECLCVPHSALT